MISDAICMKQPDALPNARRKDNNSNINNVSINVDRNHSRTTNTVDDSFKVLGMFAKFPGLRIELHNFTEFYVACRRN